MPKIGCCVREVLGEGRGRVARDVDTQLDTVRGGVLSGSRKKGRLSVCAWIHVAFVFRELKTWWEHFCTPTICAPVVVSTGSSLPLLFYK